MRQRYGWAFGELLALGENGGRRLSRHLMRGGTQHGQEGGGATVVCPIYDEVRGDTISPVVSCAATNHRRRGENQPTNAAGRCRCGAQSLVCWRNARMGTEQFRSTTRKGGEEGTRPHTLLSWWIEWELKSYPTNVGAYTTNTIIILYLAPEKSAS